MTSASGGRIVPESAAAWVFREQLRSGGSRTIVRCFPEGVLVVFDDELRLLCAGGKGLPTVGLTQDVNDTAGHAAGDAVLMESARRLQGCVRTGDTVARVGGDEFVLVIEPRNRAGTDRKNNDGNDDRDLALRMAERVITALRVPIAAGGMLHHVTVSVGVPYPPLAPQNGGASPSATTCIEEADEAMYRAKHQGKNGFAVCV